MAEEKSLFEKELENLGITLTERQKEQFDRYYEMLTEWNRVMNLTGITDYDEVNLKHFTDSLTIVRIKNVNEISTLIDVGTGAGFPGIPIKIVFPHIKVVLLDSLNKRIRFLNAVAEELNLENVETLHGRAEDFARKKEYRERFDLCVSRAVANLSTLSEYCLPFVNKGGSFVSYKGSISDEELHDSKRAVEILGGKIVKCDKFMLGDTDNRRTLLEIEKVKNTPGKYPRKAGVPSKEPIM
ncbi:16S rRNA (guanine(527)-N(7))-methyltransferase RsmG [Ruminococcus sp. CLA-AA-H200]|uniref:Ribosomal RNA small subunit methyltransferase G n=1 Tax=Ruminococcus turbiniformis TaxID=2881258 RepID=A0ABS8G021_9FIRM|nr:16S rRNA (guanine(527)-N(7))-methyltransferase RsmG [Ruminococcus turbiniformis]MCC2255611.1 16S rRNA (guanine(527)-N(7))-methyltransferase RsmG [Ruminococcus turbiniformis]